MTPKRYDIVVLGGAFSGAATALLLRRRHPEWSVLVVERNPAFDRKVGESTVELSSYFLTHVLRLHDHLSREHLPKQGLRFWFHHGDVSNVHEASEAGPDQQVRALGFQLDRSVLDEHVLKLAAEAGAEVWRPAKVSEVRLAEVTGEPENRLTIEKDGDEIEVSAAWVVDATGRSAILARTKRMLHPVPEHPMAAIWARFNGVEDLDGHKIAGNDTESPYSKYSICSKRQSTNHFTGWGYWIWFIPLKSGETSIGAVWDKRLVEPEGNSPEERLNWFLKGNPLTRQLTENAEPIEGDLRSFVNLAYRVDRVAGSGWSLVGDAAGFLDPFYSPGLDQASFTITWTLELLEHRLAMKDEEKFAGALKEHNIVQHRYFEHSLYALYLDKYQIMGDYDTMMAAMLLDTSLYYFFGIIPVYRFGTRNFMRPPFYHPVSTLFAKGIGFYKNRLATIARRRLKLGVYGMRNRERRPKLRGFTVDLGSMRMLFHGLFWWFRAEAEHAWSFIARPRPLKKGMPGPMRAPAAAEVPETPLRAPERAPTLTNQ